MVVAVPAQFARADGFVAEAGVEAVCVGVCLIDVQANAGFVAGKRHFGQGAQQRFADATTALLRGDGNGVQIPFVREGFGVGKEALRRVKAVLL